MKPSKGRIAIMQFCIFLLAGIYISRLAYLQIVQHHFYQDKSQSQLEKRITIYPKRGIIYDRNHAPLALTEPAYSAYMNPRTVTDNTRALKKVARHLGVPWKRFDRKRRRKTSFQWLKRKVSEKTYTQINTMDIEGIHFIKEEKRVYPHHQLGAHILGFVGIDNQGLGGLEYKYDTALKGSPGQILFEGDPRKRRLSAGRMETIADLYDGSHIITTLDEYIQYRSEVHLQASIDYNRAQKGIVVVMDPDAGDILAMASLPGFDPNRIGDSSPETRKNSGITDVFEPGSIFKIITAAAVLEEGLVQPNSIIQVPETLTLYNKTISEAHDREDPNESDDKTVTEIIQYSLNVGTSKLAIKLGKEKFFRYIKSFGFGRRTQIGLPGESPGLFRHVNKWSGVDIAMTSFGQGIAVTPIQMAVAASAIANGGKMVKPRVVQYITDSNEETLKAVPRTQRGRIISEKTAKEVRDIMVETVENGTGQIVKIPGIRIGGKTGTAQKAKANGLGYEKGKYVSSFVGFFPAEDPKYLILVAIDSPERHYYGSTVAGPVFKNIAKDIIDYHHIIPRFEKSD